MIGFHGFRPAPLRLPRKKHAASLLASSASTASSLLLKKEEKRYWWGRLLNYRVTKTSGSGGSRGSRGSDTPWFGSSHRGFDQGNSHPDEFVDSQAKQ